jgi:hypothetical protein
VNFLPRHPSQEEFGMAKPSSISLQKFLPRPASKRVYGIVGDALNGLNGAIRWVALFACSTCFGWLARR